ncbi:hypothetical protein BPT24_289 [Tenacibaculum phage pT24]|uniref:Uncharacterized protein n=1 Tax=Tenacibaculum phage pT24 TaxID=1880590 RepID=A0A1B4XX73_9CAUD|nr:hypothetical protein HYP10_gp238 [Tenacibaculum phage pT24]BAV39407.1 hypothetical protein BPT24_289 [Tenacibaculum phage pT24]
MKNTAVCKIKKRKFYDEIFIELGETKVFVSKRLFKSPEKHLETFKKNIKDVNFIHIDNDVNNNGTDKWYFIVYDSNDVIFGMSKFYKSRSEVEEVLRLIGTK